MKGCWSGGDDDQYRFIGGSQAPLLALHQRNLFPVTLDSPVRKIITTSAPSTPSSRGTNSTNSSRGSRDSRPAVSPSSPVAHTHTHTVVSDGVTLTARHAPFDPQSLNLSFTHLYFYDVGSVPKCVLPRNTVKNVENVGHTDGVVLH